MDDVTAGSEPLLNPFFCPLYTLSIYLRVTPLTDVFHSVSTMHECIITSQLSSREANATMERESVKETRLVYDHD